MTATTLDHPLTTSNPDTSVGVWGVSGFGVVDRVAVRALVRRLVRDVEGCRSVGRCGLPFGAGLVGVSGGVRVGGGVRACRSGLRCVWCSWFGSRRLVEWGSWFVGCHGLSGGWFAHSVLTVPHRSSDRLRKLLQWLSGAWPGLRSFVRGHGVGVVSSLVVLQVKWSPEHGWHPHFHVLWFCGGDREAVAGFGSGLSRVWAEQVETVSGRRPGRAGVFTEGHEDPMSWLEYAADDAGSSSDPFGGEGGSRDVFSGLGLEAVAGCERSAALLAEYVIATKGHRRVRCWSHLSRRFGSPPDVTPARARPSGVPDVWLSSGVVGAAELVPHKSRRSLLHEGLALLKTGSPGAAAEFWSAECGRGVEVVDGPSGPLIRLMGEKVETSEMSESNGSVLVAPGGVMRRRLRAAVEAMSSSPQAFTAIESTETPRANSVERADFDRVMDIHRLVVASDDVELVAAWESVVAARFDSSNKFGKLWDLVREAAARLDELGGGHG